MENVALPFEFVLAVNVLPLTFKVTFADFNTWFLLFFKVIVYFLVLTFNLKLAELAIIFGLAFLTVTLTVAEDLL